MDKVERRKVRARRLRVLKSTRKFYFGPKWGAKATRAYDKIEGSCVFKTRDGRNCAIGRLWPETHTKSGTVKSNDTLVLRLAKRDGLWSGDNNETIQWFQDLQDFHDAPDSYLDGTYRADVKQRFNRLEAAA